MQEVGYSGFFEAYNECSFYFLASLIKNLLVKIVFASYYLKLSLPVSSFLPNFSLMFLIDIILMKKRAYVFQIKSEEIGAIVQFCF